MIVYPTRHDLVASMTDSLRNLSPLATEADAIRALMATNKFRYGDIAMLADEALQEARRRAAAKVGSA